MFSKIKIASKRLHLKWVKSKYGDKKFQREDPIIVLGMHRSGTTMLGECLSQLGIFLGKECEVHGESKFIMKCNEDVLYYSHSVWDDTRNLPFLYEHPSRVQKFTEKLKKQVSSDAFIDSYIGLENITKFYEHKIPWGWKEPRTTVLWPLWQDVFPKSKFIFLYRNGVDVAESLRKREPSQVDIVNKLYPSLRCMELQRAFKVWEEYNELYYSLREQNPSTEVLEICYENLLENPIQEFEKIMNFLGLNIESELIKKVTGNINSSRAYSYAKSPELKAFYEEVKNTSTMKKLGYDQLT